VHHPARQRRLLASLADSGQQTPIVVVTAEGQADRYVVIDGYERIKALEQLGRDTVEAVVWPMSEAAAVLLDRSLRLSEHETALEVGWLLAELEQRFGYGLDELARRFDRSVSWVSRRLALVEVLPEAIQQQVREGKILAQVALKFLVPVARQNLEDCQRMAAIFAQHHCDTREAGQLYAAWRKGSPAIRKRILNDPELFFKAQRQTQENAETARRICVRLFLSGMRCKWRRKSLFLGGDKTSHCSPKNVNAVSSWRRWRTPRSAVFCTRQVVRGSAQRFPAA
jgi:ParB family transcriptional regulator, chromosome partitioning protein